MGAFQPMFEIIDKKTLAENVVWFRIRAPQIARKQRAGQFVILRVHEHGERIPLTISGSDGDTISIIVQAVGKTTKLLCALAVGDCLRDVVGPLGKPSDIHRYGTVVVIGGGLGTAIAYPTARALKDAGNHVIAIIGGRTKDLVILENEIREVSHELYITTDDGSYGDKGLVTDKLRTLLTDQKIDMVLAIGPIPMMRAVAEATRPVGIETHASLNPIMVDGTGMCGGCRVLINGRSQFACVDGPEFDAHEVDFDVLAKRNAAYRNVERASLQKFQEHPERDMELVAHTCRLKQAHPEVGPR
jgi:ferredoxin/flavodoxin---NADP+ reductase